MKRAIEKQGGRHSFSLREPLFRADNLGLFSAEMKARFHAVRILRCMKALRALRRESVRPDRP